ncbi:MAG TPA: bifunctional [glutamate--ammonia ligase]-adenylyl-L-tyrosine phosphorylase/[glutamate--ammonia-ligase] adenylyltransferase, partial [bacterium]|nr:bifunctional [glutamate--ammonia ligase]-adenylyl-L-tyrosine phosphorylase/[glutamate--ammonia-ligase] adenylyltransferase [bacterium]
LQLVNAGKRPEIRSRGTPDGLARLAAAGLVPAREAKRLTDAWEFLRRLEHRLQARELAQTHSLPTDDAELAIIATSMGFPREGSALLSALAGHRAVVAEAFDGLFREKSRKAAAAAGPETALLTDEALTEERATQLAADLEIFADPRRAADSFAHIRRGPARSPQKERAFRYLARIAPTLFQELEESPDPDAAVSNLERFLSKIGGRTTLLAILAEHPPATAMLTRLFGTSEFLSSSFITRPELLDVLLGSGIAEPVRRRPALRAELAAVDAAAAPSGLEARLDALRRFRAGEILRIGIADLGSSLDLSVLQRQLSMVAECVVERAFTIACDAENAPRSGLAVLGMGRLGGREMAYASDVDLVFFCDELEERHLRVAQRMLSVLSAPTREGIAYRVDTRLRPSGSSGVLVVSLAAFRTYHQTMARTWERQAWTRARAVAGDLRFWRKASARVHALTFAPVADRAALAREVREMRETMEKQIGRPQTATYNMKTGRGGLVDVEFAAQFLQLCHGLGDPSTRSPHTLTALRRSAAAGHLSKEDFSALAEGYTFVHHLENRLRIVADRPVDEVPASDEAWDSLARRARVAGSGKNLRAEYERISSAVRAAFERVLTDV